MDLIRIFSNFIAIRNLDLDHKSMRKFCYEKFQDTSNAINDKQWWVTEEEMLNSVMSPLFSTVESEFNRLHKEIGLSEKYYQDIKHSWITLDNCYATSFPHSHPTAFFSAVYYISASEKCGSIEFMTPNAAQQQMYDLDMVEKYTEFSSTKFTLEPRTGSLIIFPSWLVHYVNENLSGEDRISIAINSDLKANDLPS